MRPKFLALLAVTGLALAGCSTAEAPAEPAKETVPAPSASASPSKAAATAKVAPSKSSNSKAEKQYLDFVDYRLGLVGVSSAEYGEKRLLKAGQDYCEHKKSVTLAPDRTMNKNVEHAATSFLCPDGK